MLVDGSQAAVHMPVDVQDLDCDFYVFTGHKTYGPTGIGVLYAKKKHLDAMPPFMGGGEMIESVHQDADHLRRARRTSSRPARRRSCRRSGSAPRSTTCCRWGASASPPTRPSCATTRTSACASSTGSRSTAPRQDKGAIVSFSIDGLHPHDISTIIDRSGVAVRAGHHCAQPLMERLGVTATCRASFAMYNTKAEVDALAEALIKAHDFFG